MIHHLSGDGVKLSSPVHNKGIKSKFPAPRQAAQQDFLISDVERIKSNAQAVYDLGIASKSPHGKIERRQTQVRDHHEYQKVFYVRKYLPLLGNDALFWNCLEHKPSHHKGGLTARQHKKVAEEFSQKIFGTGYGFRENERIDADAKVSDRRIGHHERRV